MNKREYLTKLKEYLSYELPDRMVVYNLNYYSDYIDQETGKGRNVNEVLEDLGDPQLIARTIIDAAKSGADGIPYTADDEDYSDEIYNRESGKTGGSYGGGSYGSGSGYGSSGYGSSGYGSGQSSSGGSDQRGQQTGSYGRGQSGNGRRPDIHTFNFGCFPLILMILVFFSVLSLVGSLIGAASPLLSLICMVLLIMWLLNRSDRSG